LSDEDAPELRKANEKEAGKDDVPPDNKKLKV